MVNYTAKVLIPFKQVGVDALLFFPLIGVSPFHAALSKAFARHVSEKAAKGVLAPFVFRDKNLIPELINEAGFKGQTLQVITVNRILGEASKSIPSEIATTIAQYRNDEGFAVPQSAYLFAASA